MTARGSAIDGRVFGFDYCGFSDWVQRRIDTQGDAAAEWVTEQLDAAFAHIETGLRGAGFEPVETLGDGLIALADPGAASDTALGDIVAQAGLGLPFRSACALGSVQPIALVDRLTLWAGPGIARCHLAMRAAPERDDGGAPRQEGAFAPHRLLRAEIVSETVGFVCLRQGKAALSPDTLQAIAQLVDASAAAFGSAIEKATQDEKGILLRAHFASDAEALAWSRYVREGLDPETDFGIGLAHGLLYRRASANGRSAPVVHGAAVNRAAKLAGRTRDLACAPEVDTRTVHLRRGALGNASLVLRAEEEAAIVGELARGHRLIEIVAEPGLGKSHLLGRFADRWPERAITTAARPQAVLEPYRVLRDLLLSAATSGEDRALCRRPAMAGEAALIAWGDRICAALRRGIATRPTLLIIDDLQWADALSLKAMASLYESGARFLVARRPGKAPLAADRNITLAPLGDEAIRTLLGPLGDDDAFVRLTAGNPFHAVQLSGALHDGVRLDDAADADAVVDARLRALADADRAIVRLAAIAARPLPADALAALARRSAFDLAPNALDRLVGRRFLHAGDGRYEVVHQLLADRMLATLPPSLVPGLHHDAARVLSALARTGPDPVTPDEVATHWAAAGAHGRASLCFGKAGLDALDHGAHAAALAFLERAETSARDSKAGTSRRGLWAASRALAAWGQGNVALCAAEADRARAQLAGHWAPAACPASRQRVRSARLRAHVAGAEAGYYRGDLGAILRGNLGAIRWGAGTGDPSSARARGLAFVATTLGMLRGGPVARIASRIALAVDRAPRSAAYVHAARAVVHLGFGQWTRADARLALATAALDLDPEPQLAEVLLTLAALRHQLTGEAERSRACFIDLGRKGHARGNALIEAWSHYGQAMPLIGAGDFAAGIAAIDRARGLFNGLGDLQSELICHGLRAQAAAFCDDRDAALALCDTARDRAARLPPTNFGSLEGYSGAALALARLARHARSAGERDAIIKRYRATRRPLSRYARAFPIGRPRLAFADALLAGRADRMDRAAVAATRLGMHGDACNMAPDGLWRINP
ncbi:AAA family ATPase [Sphingomonas sp. ERG5]|uniref:AAA family ATPase n=1 Tax=Sphingomonas sp. ERG5 TaxID=1381597 RepID=UPI0013648D62|nr:ATP-binding protein [Sphingomonas sp. ERG5]